MKNVYFAQPSNILLGSVYLPYSVGAIAAYSWQFEEIKSTYNLGDFIFIQEDISEVASRLQNPYLVGFSCYMWNREYNLSLAKEIKKLFPDCITVFGGPDVSENTDFLEKYDFVDIVMCSEGEVTFKKLFDALNKSEPLETVCNICFRKNGIPFVSEKETAGDISDFPSPYTTGIFDSIISNPKYAGMQFDVVFETNRGCPHKCIFCYWGHSKSKLRCFPIEKIKAEIDWFVKHKIEFCFCADGNFGIFERDEEIADYIVNQKKLHGYPVKLESLASKNKVERVFNIYKKLSDAGMSNGASVAVQSLSDEVLEAVGRKSMDFDEFSSTLKKYSKAEIMTYTDLMLGLPCDTYESFSRSLLGVVEAGQHHMINIFPFEMLPNTQINTPEFIEKYKVKTVKSRLCLTKIKRTDPKSLGSRSEIVVETSTMSRNDWKKAFRLATLVQGFHCMGPLLFIAVYLRREKNISYYDFYTSLYEWSEKNNNFIKSVTDRVCSCLDGFLEGKDNLGFADENIGELYWQFQEGQFILAAIESEEFYADVREFIKTLCPDSDELNDVLRYQKKMLVTPDTNDECIEFDYDWHKYFEDICDTKSQPPQRKKTVIHFKGKEFSDNYDYAVRIAWRGKRERKMLAFDSETV